MTEKKDQYHLDDFVLCYKSRYYPEVIYKGRVEEVITEHLYRVNIYDPELLPHTLLWDTEIIVKVD